MARLELTYGTLDLNDGTTWRLRPGFDPGADELSYDEHRAYKGTVAQYNVSEAHLVEMFVPLLVAGTSLVDLHETIETLNAEIAAGAQTLVCGPVSYSCVYSPRVPLPFDELALTAFCSFVDFRPVRNPGYEVGS